MEAQKNLELFKTFLESPEGEKTFYKQTFWRLVYTHPFTRINRSGCARQTDGEISHRSTGLCSNAYSTITG